MSALSWTQRVTYGFGAVLNELTAAIWFSYLIVYLQYVLKMDTSIAGLILLVGQVVDAVSTPLIGYESDITSGSCCRKFGRKKFLHMLGSLCVILSFPFIYIRCPGCEQSSNWALFVYLVPFIVVFQFGWAATQIAHMALIPVLTPNQSERDLLSAIRNTFEMFANVITYVIAWIVFNSLSYDSHDSKLIEGNDAHKFMAIVLIVTGMGILFTLGFYLGVPNDGGADDEVFHSSSSSDSFIDWTDWLKNYKFYLVGILYTCTRMIQNMSAVFIPLYLQEYLRATEDFMAKIPLVMNITAFLASCMLHIPMERCGKKFSYLVGAVLGLGACFWISVGSGGTFCDRDIYIVALMLGTADSVMTVCALSFIADLIGTNVERGSFVYGTMSFSEKLINGLSILFIQYLHSVECKECDWFYRGVMSYGIGCLILFSLVILATLLPVSLNDRSVRKRERMSHYTVLNPAEPPASTSVVSPHTMERTPLLH